MKRTLVTSLAAVAFAGPAFAGPASDAVMFFYSEPLNTVHDPAFHDRFVDPALTQLVNDDRIATESEGMGCIDFALQLDAQDYDDQQLARTLVLSEDVKGDEATVTASFNLFGGDPDADRTIRWSLKKVGGDWKIADIAGQEWRLSGFDCK